MIRKKTHSVKISLFFSGNTQKFVKIVPCALTGFQTLLGLFLSYGHAQNPVRGDNFFSFSLLFSELLVSLCSDESAPDSVWEVYSADA
jgi:hypothetical protein